MICYSMLCYTILRSGPLRVNMIKAERAGDLRPLAVGDVVAAVDGHRS